MRTGLLLLLVPLGWLGKLVLERDYENWAPRVTSWLVRFAGRLLTGPQAQRWRREWDAECAAGGGLVWAALLPWAAVAVSTRSAVTRVASVNPLWLVWASVTSAPLLFLPVVAASGDLTAILAAVPAVAILAAIRLAFTDVAFPPFAPAAITAVAISCLVSGRGAGIGSSGGLRGDRGDDW